MISLSSLHHYILREIIALGFAPNSQQMAEYFGVDNTTIETSLKELADYHGVVLHPHKPEVWVIHPFALAPTNFYVTSAEGEWWGNCAWCSLGIAAIVKTDVIIKTTIGAEGMPTEINIKNGQIQEPHYYIHFPVPMKNAWDNVIYTCSTMLLFENESQVEEWSTRHNIPPGDVQPIQKIWEFSKRWYGNHLDPNWTKWTVDEARDIFAQFQLKHPVWDLGSSTDRF